MNSLSTDDPRPIGRRTYLKALGATALMGSLAGCGHPTELVAPWVANHSLIEDYENVEFVNGTSVTSEIPIKGQDDISMTSRTTSYRWLSPDQEDDTNRLSFVTIPIPKMRKAVGPFKKGQDISPWLAWVSDFARVLIEHPSDTLKGDHGAALLNRLDIIDRTASEIEVEGTMHVDEFEQIEDVDDVFPDDVDIQSVRGSISANTGDDHWDKVSLMVMKGTTREPGEDESWHQSVLYSGFGDLTGAQVSKYAATETVAGMTILEEPPSA